MATIQERIERSFYEAVRLKVVADGYTPDITTYSQDPSGYAQYEADLKTILNTQGFAVEVYGMSNPEDKGYKKLARIVLITDAFLAGDFGIERRTEYVYNETNGNYDGVTPTQNLSHQLFMKCCIVCDDTAQFRYLVDVINSTLPLRGYLPYYDVPDTSFFTETTSFMDLSSATEGILEKVYTYRVPDVVWTEDILDPGAAVPITYINLLIQAKLGIYFPATSIDVGEFIPPVEVPAQEFGLIGAPTSHWIPESVPYFLKTKDDGLIKTNNDQLILVNK